MSRLSSSRYRDSYDLKIGKQLPELEGDLADFDVDFETWWNMTLHQHEYHARHGLHK